MPFPTIKTFSAKDRHNLVRIDNLRNPSDEDAKPFESKELQILAQKLKEAKDTGKKTSCFFGAHVVKSGLSRYIIWLMEQGYIHHISSNGAGSIHDFELAFLGGTSEHVPTAIEDGSFGMWEETGRWMNEAIISGHKKDYGYGQSLYAYAKENKARFPYLEDCLFYRAYEMGIPATYHVTIGADIIHQHPIVDFAAIGGTSGVDFKYFCKTIAQIEGGAHMNIGSAVTGPEVFLKALSIARNQGHHVYRITTANFDILSLGDYKSDVKSDKFDYYYRPRKNVINRPTSRGGTGLYIMGNHADTIPGLYRLLSGDR